MSSLPTLLAAAAAAAAAVSSGTESGNHQVHLAQGLRAGSLKVAFTTTGGEGGTSVAWGAGCEALNSTSEGDVRAFTQDAGRTWYTRTAEMTGLRARERYCYEVRVGGRRVGRATPFVYHRDAGSVEKHVLFGDMGAAAAFALCDRCRLASEVCDASVCGRARDPAAGLVGEVGSASLFYHAGDFGYNLADNGGTTGDNFMRNVEQLAARVPYMVNHGNHEDEGANLPHFVERFRNMPANAEPGTVVTANGETTNSLYFSFDHGLVHYVSYSTELWEGVHTDRVTKETFLAWFERDLAAVNRRRGATPWVVVSGHRALYTSQPTNGTIYPEDKPIRAAMEPLLFKYGVDLCVNGHIHNYERSWPTYEGKTTQSNHNPNAPIYMVTGAAGSKEMSSPFGQPAPFWSAFRSNCFSYSRMLVHNATHLRWQQVLTDPAGFPNATAAYGTVLDDVWIVQHNHGPFDPRRAPSGVPAAACVTRDHFTPEMLGIEDGSGRPTYEQVRAYKRRHGPAAYSQRLREVLAKLNGNATASAVWEDESLGRDTAAAYFAWKDPDTDSQ